MLVQEVTVVDIRTRAYGGPLDVLEPVNEELLDFLPWSRHQRSLLLLVERRFEFLQDFLFGVAVDVFAFASLQANTAYPSAISALVDRAFAVSTSFCHMSCSPLLYV